MRHTCEHCATTYEIPDDKVAGRFLKVRCKSCAGTMHVVGLRPLDATGSAGARWWCAMGHEPRGPYRDDELLSLVAAGDVHARSRMWRPGMRSWERVCESEALAWVYQYVIDAAMAGSRAGNLATSVFDRAALLSDGHGYFPDPTLKSGIMILDAETQQHLNELARKNGILPDLAWNGCDEQGSGAVASSPSSYAAHDTRRDTPQDTQQDEAPDIWPRRELVAPLAAAALSLLAAAVGLAWFIATPIA